MIIRSISAHSSLRGYVETLPDLTLAKLRKVLRVHYREKTASEHYEQLATAYQQPLKGNAPAVLASRLGYSKQS